MGHNSLQLTTYYPLQTNMLHTQHQTHLSTFDLKGSLHLDAIRCRLLWKLSVSNSNFTGDKVACIRGQLIALNYKKCIDLFPIIQMYSFSTNRSKAFISDLSSRGKFLQQLLGCQAARRAYLICVHFGAPPHYLGL